MAGKPLERPIEILCGSRVFLCGQSIGRVAKQQGTHKEKKTKGRLVSAEKDLQLIEHLKQKHTLANTGSKNQSDNTTDCDRFGTGVESCSVFF